MLIAVCGKSNTGKTTFFSAATLVDAEISNRIFTTIKPNKGVSYARAPCPCKKLGVKCSPQNSKCIGGVRYIPVKLIDIAGLVPGAHKGKGLGNQFLSDIMEAQALVHIVDISGGTDQDGNPIAPGTHDPIHDIGFFVKEIDYWILGILQKNWDQIKRKATLQKEKFEDILHKQLSGLGIGLEEVKEAAKETGVSLDSSEEELLRFVEAVRKTSKPILVAGNKVDVPGADKIYHRIKETKVEILPCCAEAELALRRAAEKGIIKYAPGDTRFGVLQPQDEKHQKALEFIQKGVLDKFGSTGVQEVINKAVFDLLDMIVVYPVASISRLADSRGNILPDAHLVRKGTTLREFAQKVHTTMAEHFIGGIGLDKRKVGADYELKDGDVIEILFRK
ncbi:MAG: redox-regulated ATPase YchF [Candidatus Aenigmatarchaeota archaeon]